jgi:hypothetical protein
LIEAIEITVNMLLVDFVLAMLFQSRRGSDDVFQHIPYKRHQVEELWEDQQPYSVWPSTSDFKNLGVQVVRAKFCFVHQCEKQGQSVQIQVKGGHKTCTVHPSSRENLQQKLTCHS